MRPVRHLIVKRRTLDLLLSEVRALGLEPAFADCWDETGRAGLPVDFLAALRPQAAAAPRLSASRLTVLAAVLGVSALAIWAMRHEAALAALTARSEAARAEAAATRLAVEASETASARIEALSRRLSNRLPAARIIEELTAIIPDSAWVSDLRIDGEVVEFTGYAKSAAALIPLLEAAPLFQEASLTSPIVLDSAEDKERFSVRLRLALAGAGSPSATEEDIAAEEAVAP
jgi:general secretion pathway protein L